MGCALQACRLLTPFWQQSSSFEHLHGTGPAKYKNMFRRAPRGVESRWRFVSGTSAENNPVKRATEMLPIRPQMLDGQLPVGVAYVWKLIYHFRLRECCGSAVASSVCRKWKVYVSRCQLRSELRKEHTNKRIICYITCDLVITSPLAVYYSAMSGVERLIMGIAPGAEAEEVEEEETDAAPPAICDDEPDSFPA